MILKDVNSPVALLDKRMQALLQADFSLIYDSYHPDAPFLAHFANRADYLTFAERQLAEIRLSDWGIFGQRKDQNGDVEVLLWMQIGAGDKAQDLFELALLIRTDSGWRYHSAQKLTREEYSGAVSEISFHHFDQAIQKTRF